MSIRHLRVLIVLILLGSVAGLGRSPVLAKSRAHGELAHVHFILSWVPNVQFAGLWVAQQKGWFRQAGIDMTFKSWAPGVFPETDVPARGGSTFGFQSGAAIAIARAKGVPITALYADAERSVFGLTVLASSPIHSIRQFRGKTIAYQPSELYVPETMLSCVGLQEGRDYRTVQAGFDVMRLTSGQADGYMTFLVNEPVALRLHGVRTRSFPAADYCFHFYDVVMFAPDSLIKKDPALVRAVTRVVARGYTWAHQHPDLAARLTVAHYFSVKMAGNGVSARENLQQQILESRGFGRFSKDPNGRFSGLMTAKYWQDSINILLRYHLISRRVNPNAVFTNAFNPNR
jgi:NitT/TauT family transport system substrate-binding protein